MNDIAIQVENLSKQYHIGATQARYQTFREAAISIVASPIRRVGKLLRGQASGAAELDEIIWALKDVSFDVKHGEVVGIIGRNGAGKSTLLKILSRITEPTVGRARIRGRMGSLLEVGTGFHQELTGRENTYLNGAILGMKRSEIDRRFDEIIDFSGVEKFIDTPVKHYSSGMKVRLAFAVAAHLEPEILLVDEVLAVGDVAFQKKCLGKMEDVAAQGRTVLFVSHNMAAVSNLCQRAILLHDGRVSAEGSTESIIERYLANASDLTNIALAARTDRKGLGQIVIRDIEFLNGQGNQIEHPISGQEIIIRMHYHAKDGKLFKNCRVTTAIKKNERIYCLLSTDLVDKEPLDLQGDGHIDFVMPALPLSENSYILDTFIESNKQIQDWVTDAAKVFVVDGDFYGTGRIYPSQSFKGRYVLVDFWWTQNNGQRVSGFAV